MDKIYGENLQNCVNCLTNEDALEITIQCLKILINLKNVGLIHGDFNEFNIMIQFPPLEKYSFMFKEGLSEHDFDN